MYDNTYIDIETLIIEPKITIIEVQDIKFLVRKR